MSEGKKPTLLEFLEAQRRFFPWARHAAFTEHGEVCIFESTATLGERWHSLLRDHYFHDHKLDDEGKPWQESLVSLPAPYRDRTWGELAGIMSRPLRVIGSNTYFYGSARVSQLDGEVTIYNPESGQHHQKEIEWLLPKTSDEPEDEKWEPLQTNDEVE